MIRRKQPPPTFFEMLVVSLIHGYACNRGSQCPHVLLIASWEGFDNNAAMLPNCRDIVASLSFYGRTAANLRCPARLPSAWIDQKMPKNFALSPFFRRIDQKIARNFSLFAKCHESSGETGTNANRARAFGFSQADIWAGLGLR